jgi:hypothetical protein
VSTEQAVPAVAASRDSPWLRRSALLLLAGLAGLSCAWALGRDPLEPYYAAAVRSMSMSWHNFIYGAFDPAGTITLDKLPGAFWVQALAVRAFGVHTWVIVLPQAIEGVLTVLFLYRAVQRLAGPAAGLIAAAVLVVSPATVALNRGNISDSLMILLLVLAADAVSAALARGSQGRLVLAAVWVGLAFQAKMIEAWLVLPAFGLVYLVSAPRPVGRRIRQLAVAGAVTALVSLSWMSAVSLVPAAHRPYIDGSHDNSAYEQVFVYNGFGRFGEQTPLQLLAGQSPGLGVAVRNPVPAPERLLRGSLGRDTGWLLPAALIVAGWGIVSRRRQPRGDPLRACFVLWGGWLVLLAVTFSERAAGRTVSARRPDRRGGVGVHLRQRAGGAAHRRVHRHDPVADAGADPGRRARGPVPPGAGHQPAGPAAGLDRRALRPARHDPDRGAQVPLRAFGDSGARTSGRAHAVTASGVAVRRPGVRTARISRRTGPGPARRRGPGRRPGRRARPGRPGPRPRRRGTW